MPAGFQGVREAAADIERRKSQGGTGDGRLWFKLADGESAAVRFLEQGEDVHWAWMHEMPPRGKQKWGDNLPCMNTANDGTHCPKCEAGVARKFVGMINIIWRDGPVFKKNADGFFEKDAANNMVKEGTADVLAVWEQGINVFEELDAKDATYGGLTSRDFRVTRKGKEFSTRYLLEPAIPDGGPIPMSTADVELAKNKADLTPDVTPPDSYDDSGSAAGFGEASATAEQISAASPFLR